MTTLGSHVRKHWCSDHIRMLFVGLALLFPLAVQTGWAESALHVSGNGRYLVQPNGKPFFWLGDTAWLLSQMTTREDADFYLETRAQQGFTVIQAAIVMGEERV
ncbi:MAG: DUF4038 domain-containing protein, partial [Sedimentisphaerales bacterium]|nr:DUF4038 domain-containing protein [Sedimentisphaerales bacterium]